MPKRKRTPSPDEPELNMALRRTHPRTHRNTPPPPRTNAPTNLTYSWEFLPRFFSPLNQVNTSGGPSKKSRRKKKGVKRRKSVGGKRRRKGKKTKKKGYCYR